MTLGFSHAGGYYTTGRHLEEGGHLLTLNYANKKYVSEAKRRVEKIFSTSNQQSESVTDLLKEIQWYRECTYDAPKKFMKL